MTANPTGPTTSANAMDLDKAASGIDPFRVAIVAVVAIAAAIAVFAIAGPARLQEVARGFTYYLGGTGFGVWLLQHTI